MIDVGIIPIWIGAIFQGPRIRNWIEHAAATSAGQYNISLNTLNKLPIEIPPIDEQQIILENVEAYSIMQSRPKWNSIRVFSVPTVFASPSSNAPSRVSSFPRTPAMNPLPFSLNGSKPKEPEPLR